MDIAKVGPLTDDGSLARGVHIEAISEIVLEAVVTEATRGPGPFSISMTFQERRDLLYSYGRTYETTTRSPFFREKTASPTSVTIPTPSWPITHGGSLLPKIPVPYQIMPQHEITYWKDYLVFTMVIMQIRTTDSSSGQSDDDIAGVSDSRDRPVLHGHMEGLPLPHGGFHVLRHAVSCPR